MIFLVILNHFKNFIKKNILIKYYLLNLILNQHMIHKINLFHYQKYIQKLFLINFIFCLIN